MPTSKKSYSTRSRKRTAARSAYRKKRAGVVLPKNDKILDQKVSKITKSQTMYAPMQNMRSTLNNFLMQNVGPFGQRWAGRLKYVDGFTLSSGPAGAYNELTFNLNSLFDPDRSGIGHQPLGFDQLALLYGRYRVLKTTYKISPCDLQNQNNSTGIVVYVNNDPTSLGSVSRALEQGYSHFTHQNVFAAHRVLKGTVNLPALTGTDLESYRGNNSQYAALVSGNPTETMPLHIGVEGTNSIVSVIAFYIELEFDCEFFDANELNQS